MRLVARSGRPADRRPITDLLVAEAVRGALEPADVEALPLRTRGVPGDDKAISRLESHVVEVIASSLTTANFTSL